MADSDLTLPATVATELGVSSGDAKLPRYVSAVSDAVRKYLNRARVHYGAGISEPVKGFGRPRLVLNVTPILSIASITLDDGTVVDSSEYSIEDAEAGFVFRELGWPYTGQVRRGLLYADRDAGTEKASITVVYTAGWVTPAQVTGQLVRTLPYDLEEAVVQACVALYRRSGEDPRIASESLGDYSVSYQSPNVMTGLGTGGILPSSVLPQLDAYVRREG